MATFESSLKSKLIYVFAINDERHKDCLKIGETTIDEDDGSDLFNNAESLREAAHKRIGQYTKTAGIAYQLLYTEISIFVRSGMIMTFNDKQVHKVLERSGIKRKEFEGVTGADEWYCCDLETVKKAIAAVKRGETSLHPSDISHGQSPIIFRPEQQEAIDKTRKRFKKGNQMLWNAKMRFGKTLSALQVVKEEKFVRTLILTHRPVVDKGWFEDFGKIFYDRKDYYYGSRGNGELFEKLEQLTNQGKKYVYFASMQDLRGSEQVGGKFDKNNEIFGTDWDFVIVDEAHEGTKTELGQNVLKELIKKDTKVLQLSGTPFNLFDDYSEEEIFTWDYVMEQKAKQEWAVDNPYEPNPYASLPAINIYTYDLGTLMSEYVEDEKAFNFREFFRTRDDDTFIHDKDVDGFLDLLCKDDKDSLYPYSNETFRRIFRHTLWIVPGVKAARALSAKLKNHPVFGKFQPVNVAGDGDEEEANEEALKKVNNAIGPDPDETYTITLSCGRLTTGVSIKPWTAVFMMAGSYSTSAAQYMQTIFRVQTPFTSHGRMKEQCYAFDFAPDRTLRVLAETAKVSAKAGKQTEEDRRILGDFLNFCPIISIDGSQMKPYDVNKMMSQLKKAQIEKVVQCGFEDGALYNDELLKLTDVELRDFDDLKKTIGTTKAMAKTGDIDVNNQGFTKEQYEEKERLEKKKKKDLTSEEQARLDELKAMSNQRRNAISILRGISIRMPLLIYGAELKNEDEEITINNFASLIDDQSWEEFMPKGVDKEKFEKFKKYYDPDIFREAGKRIREMARAADKFTIEDRIERISAIFNTFRNPDKETVLTPWRVVNMHMSESLGGWCFYDDTFNNVLSIPRYISQGIITREVFRPDSHILDINSKSGLYPLYTAYNIYRCRVEEAKQKYGEVGHGFALRLWETTIEENILVICKTKMARSITRRTLAGFRDIKVNAHYYEELIRNISENPILVVNTFRDGKHFWGINNDDNMKIDAIVGNPPYQLTVAKKETDNGQKAVTNIFHYFQILSDKLAKYTSLIYPGGRWIHRSGKGLATFGLNQINDPALSKIVFYPDANELFSQQGIPDGISIVFKNRAKKIGGFKYVYSVEDRRIEVDAANPGEDLMPLNPLDVEIVGRINRVVREQGLAFMHDSVFPRTLFGIESNFVEENPELVREYEEGDYYDKDVEIKLYTNDKAGKSGRARWYVTNKCNIRAGREYMSGWKVVVSSANAGGQKRSNQLAVLDNNSVFGRSRVALKIFKTEKEARNFYKYVKSEIIRFAFLMTDESLTSLAKQVPDIMDYSDNNRLIDFAGNIDSQLNKLFGIEEKSQEHIRDILSKKAE